MLTEKGYKVKEIEALKELLRWLRRQIKFAAILTSLIAALTVQSCVSTVESSFCLWAEPIKLTDEEIDVLTDDSVKQILFFNVNHESQCNGK